MRSLLRINSACIGVGAALSLGSRMCTRVRGLEPKKPFIFNKNRHVDEPDEPKEPKPDSSATMLARAEIWAGRPTRVSVILVKTITCHPTFGTSCAFPATMKLRIPILLAFAAGAFAQE